MKQGQPLILQLVRLNCLFSVFYPHPSHSFVAPVNLIRAFHTSLKQITQSSVSLEERFKRHREASKRIKDAATELGLRQVPIDPAFAANGMTAVSHFH
jgi:alanine-glyoxylate transaminase/serine-glyoxylate transaminase/serine-pyruvate transaminase